MNRAYFPHIDGLRALAVISVMAFHLGIDGFSFGFVGVDVFFAISGFLLASIYSDSSKASFSLDRFLKIRFLRIAPALAFMLWLSVGPAIFLFYPDDFKNFSQSLVATIGFLSNLLFFVEGGGYSEFETQQKPLLHTWSLSLEMQFYLFLGLLFSLAKNVKSYFFIFSVSSFLALIFISNFFNFEKLAFYQLPFRLWEFFMGGLVAMYFSDLHGRFKNISGWLGLLCIVFGWSAFYYDVVWSSYLTLLIIFGICCFFIADTDFFVLKILSAKPLIYVGTISYSLYIFHQPIFSFFKHYYLGGFFTIELKFIALIIVIFSSLVSFYFVEQPCRSSFVRNLKSTKIYFIYFCLVTPLILLGTIGHFSDGLKDRKTDGISMQSVAAILDPNRGLNEVCDREFTTRAECATSPDPSIAIWGDSFAMHLVPGLTASDPSIALRQLTLSGCAPILGLAIANDSGDSDKAIKCRDFNNRAFDWIKNSSVKHVVVSSPFDFGNEINAFGQLGLEEISLDEISSAFELTVEGLQDLGIKVVVVTSPPVSVSNPMDYGLCGVAVMLDRLSGEDCNFPRIDSRQRGREFLAKLSKRVAVYDLLGDLCDSETCVVTSEDKIPYYRDTNHLSVVGSELIGLRAGWATRMVEIAR